MDGLLDAAERLYKDMRNGTEPQPRMPLINRGEVDDGDEPEERD